MSGTPGIPEVPLRLGLLRAAEVIERGWNAGAFEAFDASGKAVAEYDPSATKWSIFGAIGRAATELALPIRGALDTCTCLDLAAQTLGVGPGWAGIRSWEREGLRTQAEVAGLLRMAATLAPNPLAIATDALP